LKEKYNELVRTAVEKDTQIQKLTEQVKELRNEAVKNVALEQEINNLREEMQAIFDELWHRKEVDEEVEKGRSIDEVKEDYIVKKQPKSKSK
jgi:hypothetical protein